MSLDTDLIIDRRRLKRRLSFWRFAAIILLAAGLFAFFAQNAGFGPSHQHIARVWVSGVIVDDTRVQDMLDEIKKDENVSALILRIDSPGGTTTGSEALYEKIRDVAEVKPVVAVLGTVAASGGYIAAISADHIVARGNTITGSVGVLFQWAQMKELLGHIGIEMKEVKSSPLKAEPNPFSEPSREAIRATQAMIDASYDWFLGLVQERRGFDKARARELGDGRVYTGWQAKENGLIDAIGGEEEALAWLSAERQINSELPVEDWEVREEPYELATFMGRAMGEAFSQAIAETTQKTLQTEGLTLDGLISVWHPDRR
ncbi:signal peptide peptidase SppA, 36K type [Tepidicaulis marinus]|uniref:Signal peptide peptidase SppA, 36K type n=1 Tax=Tepidicaulis marinus TaxID=1333998 RepID=A0A081BE58_9HYPH|nr:signal peptide peptidase SppA [Tepidicaulis marinus]GAK46326.1 signal peptide peptidase SppA, 36K type [Tepidicaulis marinus]